MTIVTLLSDYGIDNSTVGLLKGIMLSLAPQTTLIDLTHQLPPQDLQAAQFELIQAYCAFPKGTIHLAIVDPGISVKNRPIAFQTSEYLFVGPDNGLFTPIFQREEVLKVVALHPSVPAKLGQLEARGLFQGRDCYAPAAGLLSAGESLVNLGEVIAPDTLKQLFPRQPNRQDDRVVGWVQRVDHFGNLVTNVPGQWFTTQTWRVRLAGHTLSFCTETSNTDQQLRVRVGGHGFVEVAFEGGAASARLTCGVGQKVEFFKN